MLTITDRAELAGCLCPKPPATQAASYRFDVVGRELIRKPWRTIPLFCISECSENRGITGQTELLSRVYLMTPGAPGIPAATGHAQHPAHGFDGELSLIFFDKNILHFRSFAKYVAAFWRIASSSACSASWRLSRAFSASSSLSRADDVSCCCCFFASHRVAIHTN